MPEGFPLWRDYVAYWERRLAELKAGQKVKGPLQWNGYQGMMGQYARGRAFERTMANLLRADAKLPQPRRRWLGAFVQPSIETNVGVAKAGVEGVRYADVLVIEKAPERPPRVESLSFKSRDFRLLEIQPQALAAQVKADASAALRYYGESLNIRRPSLRYLGPEVRVGRVRLVYEGGELKPGTNEARAALDQARSSVAGVEVVVR